MLSNVSVCVLPCSMGNESWEYPEKQGLYDPALETAACGVGFIVNIDGEPSSKVSS